MRIAFLTPEYPHPMIGSSGGLGSSINNLAIALVKKKCEIFVIVYGQKNDKIFKEDGITFILIKNIKVKGFSFILTSIKINKTVNKLVTVNKLDLLEVADWTGISAFLKVNCKVIMRLHGSDSYFCYLEKRKIKSFNKFLERTAYKRANGIIAVSDFVGKKTNFVFNEKRNYTVIPNGVNTINFKKNELTQNESIILYFGTLIRKKGLLEIPIILNYVHKSKPDAVLWLVGGDASDISSGSVSTWNLMKFLFDDDALKNVKYFGKLPYSEIKGIISKANVCVFPSFAEALPVSWLEAMAMEKAIVASNIGWAKEMIEDGVEGYLIDPKDHQKYANAIIELLEDSQKATKFGHNALRRINESFEINEIAQMNIEYYRNKINEKDFTKTTI